MTTIWKSKAPDVVIPNNISFVKFLFQYFDQIDPNHVAMQNAVSGNSITFGELRRQTRLLACALTSRGIKHGDIVAICSLNSLEYIITILATSLCGAISTTCNPYSTFDELCQLFGSAKPVAVFTRSNGIATIEEVAARVTSIREIYSYDYNQMGAITFEELLSCANMKDYPHDILINPTEDLFFLPYSSGTTGFPKGVMLTHTNLIAITSLYKVFNRATYEDCMYSVLPMYHIYGMTMSMVALANGLRHIIDERFDVTRTLEIIQKEKVTVFNAVPPIVLQIEKHPNVQKYDLSSLKPVHCGAAPLGKGLPHLLFERTGIVVFQGWGLTEMVPLVVPEPQRVPANSVGFVAPNTQLKVIDEKGNPLPCNMDGEICARGPQLMKGYYKNSNATQQSITTDGWFHTGDIGHVNENGMVFIVDRLKEVIKYKGFQVAPAELESVLLTHPGILDAAVIGIPDEKAGEIPKAFVVVSDPSVTEQKIKNFVKGHVSKYKELSGGVTFIEKIPKSPSGKILRRHLKRLYTRPTKSKL